VIYPDTCMDGLTKNTNKLGNVRRPYHFRCVRPVTVPNVKFAITLKKQHTIFNTHYMISPYLNYRFTNDHRNIVSMRIYSRYLLNADYGRLRSIKLDARWSTVSSASVRTSQNTTTTVTVGRFAGRTCKIHTPS